MLSNKILYSYDDVMIEASPLSNVEPQEICSFFKENGKLPLFTSPKPSVVNEGNYHLYAKNHINAVFPKETDLNARYDYATAGNWAAFTIDEFKEFFCNPGNTEYGRKPWRAVVEAENGHLQKLYSAVANAKSIHGEKIEIIVGNIVSPETYTECYMRGVWGVRCGKDSENGPGAVNYGTASLINDIYCLKRDMYENNNYLNKAWQEMPCIIADGGIRSNEDIFKSLALGADYVMVDGMFSSIIESAYSTYKMTEDYRNGYGQKSEFLKSIRSILYEQFHEIASRNKQEGLNEHENLELFTYGIISKWVDKFISDLCPVMSYANISNISDFNPKEVTVNLISSNAR